MSDNPYASPSGSTPPPPPPPGSGATPHGQQHAYPQQPYGQMPYAGAPQLRLAGWGARVGASLLDSLLTLPGAVIMIAGIGMAAMTMASAPVDSANNPVLSSDDTSRLMTGVALMALGWLLAVVIQIWNRIFRQGRTGQSWGKKVLGLHLVDARTGSPVGAGKAFVRELAHYLDGAVYIGYLWPLWDAERRTFADMLCETRVTADR